MHSVWQTLDQVLMPEGLVRGREGEERERTQTERQREVSHLGAFKMGIKWMLGMQKSTDIQLCSYSYLSKFNSDLNITLNILPEVFVTVERTLKTRYSCHKCYWFHFLTLIGIRCSFVL